MVLSLNHQIQFVKDQQADIIASLHAECEELEEEIMGLNLEVKYSLLGLYTFCSFCFSNFVLRFTLQR